jgi:hypothetical protein
MAPSSRTVTPNYIDLTISRSNVGNRPETFNSKNTKRFSPYRYFNVLEMDSWDSSVHKNGQIGFFIGLSIFFAEFLSGTALQKWTHIKIFGSVSFLYADIS